MEKCKGDLSNSHSKKSRGKQAVGKRAKVKRESENERTISIQANDLGIAGAVAGVSRRAEVFRIGLEAVIADEMTDNRPIYLFSMRLVILLARA